ncbi:MAG: hemolysin activation protein [Phycisphaerae bacterium]
MSRSPTPIAVFAYNRAAHLRRALVALVECERLTECDVFLYCDGPKDADGSDPTLHSPNDAPDPSDVGRVTLVQQVARAWADRHGAVVVPRREHLGLAQNIVGGVTELCERYGRVIVIEDDLEIHSRFIDYMLRGLDAYEDQAAVYQVCGHMFPVDRPASADTFFLPLTSTWGWATWRRAWAGFDWDAEGALGQLADPAIRRRFDLDDSYPYARLLEERLAGGNDSWGILWWWSVFSRSGLALYPRDSLVRVGGFDGSGTHCPTGGGVDDNRRRGAPTCRMPWPLRFPSAIRTDNAAFTQVVAFLGRWSRTARPGERAATLARAINA